MVRTQKFESRRGNIQFYGVVNGEPVEFNE